MKKTFRVMLVFIAMIVVIFSFASCDKISEGGHDHKYDEWIKKTSPTCTDAGEWVRYCECGERQTETFPPVGHDFENGVCKSCAVNDPSYKAEDEGNDKDATVIVPNNLVKGTFGYENWTVFEDAMIEGTATSPNEIANAIVESGILPFMAGAMEIEVGTEYFAGFDYYTIEGYKSAAVFMPMMGSIPYVGYIFELEDGVDVYNFVDDLTVNANPRWNICVEADETLVGAFGHTVFFIMCPDRIETDEEFCNGNHDFGDWTAYEDGATDCGLKRYYRICENCETKEERSGSYDDHSFTTVTTAPTCTNVGYDTNTCQLCGRVEICNETEKLPHDRSESYLFNEEKHWKICGICENVVSEGEHVFDEGGLPCL